MMRSKPRVALLATTMLGIALVGWLTAANQKTQGVQRDELMLAFQQGNFKDAYDGLRKLALDPKVDPDHVSKDLTTAINCLQRLGRVDEIDAFLEGVIASHGKNWRLLRTAAQMYTQIEHYGFIVVGEFSRGHKRGGGRYVNSYPRDRARALQLMQQAMPLLANETDKKAIGEFYMGFADILMMSYGYHDTWRFQYLSNLAELPDYEDGNSWYARGHRGAPVDEKGNPIFHKVPKSFADAQSDGERWRWMLTQVAKADADRVSEVDMRLAQFCLGQFGVQTMAHGGWRFPTEEDDRSGDTSGPYALHTLKDTETIARLANGIKRFTLPDEFNWMVICETIAKRGKSTYGEAARDMLAREYLDRRQYVKAAEAWKKAIAEYGPGGNNHRAQQLDQIVGNWGRFDHLSTQAAGTKGTVDFRFRNGEKVSFEARPIKIDKLLDDVKAYLKSNPAQLNWQQMNVANIGYRLVQENQTQYLGEKVASWDQKLTPRPGHVDERITVTTPMTKAGAYLLTAQMANGNMSRIIIWLADTVIVKKQLDQQALYYVADAANGKPLEKANVEFFGYRQVQIAPQRNQFRVDTTNFAKFTNTDGQIILGQQDLPTDRNWLIIARKGDRLAYQGFTNIWYGQQYDPEYNATRVFLMTDRPVYRPSQPMQFKAWVRHSKYDQKDVSDFAGRAFTVRINNPKGDKVLEKEFTADEYGGVAGQFDIPAGATLGVYGVSVGDMGGGSFRVEEYKKPEFEVTVEAPKEPVKLGEVVNATVKAKYYFGEPVVNATVKVKVLRSSHKATWYPRGDWDWFYGPGYWWFAPDYNWFPGWNEWCGCRRPLPPWFWAGREQPEVVLENELPIGSDGTVIVPIDTAPAKGLHGNQDHEYSITAEVVDQSRRTIVGTGTVLVARKPFQVYSWVDRGFYRAGDTVKAQFNAQTLDRKPVVGKGELTLYGISYKDGKPVEKALETWKLDTNEEGYARQQLTAAKAGQYRLSYKLTSPKGDAVEGGYLFSVRGEGFSSESFRFGALELIQDKREYAPGEKIKLMVNTDQEDGTVLLFLRPTNGVYLKPQILRLQGKSAEEQIAVVQRDMPNFFIEALTVHGGKVHTETREIVVPPEKRVLNVEVLPSQAEYKPGQKASIKVKVTDFFGKPFVGSTVLSIYDRSVDYIAGGSNVPEIREFFWKWRRSHQPQTEINLAAQFSHNLLQNGEIGMSNLGIFGEMVVEQFGKGAQGGGALGRGEMAAADGLAMAAGPAGPGGGGFGGFAGGLGGPGERPGSALRKAGGEMREKQEADRAGGGAPPVEGQGPQPTIRKNFADTALWLASLTTDKDGFAEAQLTMPENLTGWKVKVWAMGHGTKVGEGSTEVTTKKDLLVRLQAPRFFVEKDEVVLSANVHNYLKTDKKVDVSLEVEGGTLALTSDSLQKVTIKAGGEKRVDWRVKVVGEGTAIVRMKAITDSDSDAMQMSFPCFIHGMLKTDSYSGVVRPDQESSRVELTVPRERRVADSRLEVRFTPTLAGAMVDALPYMVEYPHGCTEQTLNRFLPTVITQRILVDMKLDLKQIQEKRTNLNAQEIGDAKERAKGWKRYPRNPVFDLAEVQQMTGAGVQALTDMQLGDGGWGWFSGFGERSWPHTTAVVVHGLQLARDNGVAIVPGVVERGVQWLKTYQAQQLQMLRNAPAKILPYKVQADNLDALVYMVLVDAAIPNEEMREYLYRDRTHLSVYGMGLYGLALQKEAQAEKLAMILKNIRQYLVHDEENQTAYLKLPGDSPWWYWYGSEIEANACYLKLLARTDPKGKTAPGLVKYLLNNRKNATYWNSTRDTAFAIEAMADYLRASGEDRPDLTIEVWLDDKKVKETHVTASNLFTFDNVMMLTGDKVDAGKHSLEIRKKGTGPVYFNAYLTNFTLEDPITKAGLEVKVNRKYYKLTRVDKTIKVSGSRGQAADQKVEKYQRTELANLAELKSGELVEIELEIDSKNDYEYLLFEDPKAAGFEPMEVRSGYGNNDMGAYMELRDDRVCFFVRWLARGKHSVSYRMRAEIPGKFSALPTKASAMYAPELRGNSDELKLVIVDK